MAYRRTKASQEVVVKLLTGTAVSCEGSTRRKSSKLPHDMNLPTGLPESKRSKRMYDRANRKEAMLFCNVMLEVIPIRLTPFYSLEASH